MRPVAGTGIGGALVLVGGHSRGVGKTMTVEQVLRARASEPWVAIKVSAHRHGRAGCALTVDEATTASAETQTGRYLMAGAVRAYLLRAPDRQLAAAARFIHELRADGVNLVVESNRLVDWTMPDRILFAIEPAIDDWKPSSARIMPRADAFVLCTANDPVAGAGVRATDDRSRAMFRLANPGDRRRFGEWLNEALGPHDWRGRLSAAPASLPHVALA